MRCVGIVLFAARLEARTRSRLATAAAKELRFLPRIVARDCPLRLGSLRCKGDCCGRAGANVARRKALRRDRLTFSSDCDDRSREPRIIPKRLCPVQPGADEIRHRALRRRRRSGRWSSCRGGSRGSKCCRTSDIGIS
jgi:hypothetical protein